MFNGIGHNILRIKTIESTNKYVLGSLENDNYAAGTVVVTDFQEAGKGLGKNRWESEAGRNLLLSVVLKPLFLEPRYQFYLNKFVSLGVYDFIRSLLPDKRISVKWPNDVYIDDGKVAGILINNTLKGRHFEFVVAGIGVNINQEVFVSDAPNPVSVIHYLRDSLDLEKCLKSLLTCLNERYRQLENQEWDKIDTDYTKALYRYDSYSVFQKEGKKFNGRIKGVTEYGLLIIQKVDGEILEFDFKEVEFDL